MKFKIEGLATLMDSKKHKYLSYWFDFTFLYLFGVVPFSYTTKLDLLKLTNGYLLLKVPKTTLG